MIIKVIKSGATILYPVFVGIIEEVINYKLGPLSSGRSFMDLSDQIRLHCLFEQVLESPSAVVQHVTSISIKVIRGAEGLLDEFEQQV